MNSRCHGILAAAAILASVGCAGRRPAAAPPPAPVPIEARVFNDNAGGIRYTSEKVILDAAGWSDAWREVTSALRDQPSLPEVDFQRHMLVLVAAGRMTVVDAVRVDSIGVRREMTDSGQQEALAVYYTITRGCPPSAREAYPLEIVRVRRSTASVRFVSRTVPAPGCN